ncbi:YbaK/EbsC family protein [Dictyobacter kobayashii]|uniref:YbaK/aminoacyl-tRNA synthetase-associated domain-containing protein n=1 Tax=Dictyobacter kobayashii TaxID=2014872 RepID=A0A402AEY0_9CHLR|nr:YbaK/EbsC family protein [Dictyobacter kobayashii]GCE17612.1 hypothetical protein KDK_14120 [Dictyobacter kobayashii]
MRSELAREPEAELEEVFTPGCTTIDDLAAFLHIPTSKTMKAVLYAAGGKLILASVRGDLEVNEVKLINALRRSGINTGDLHMATPEELQQAGIVAGFTSPIGKSADIFILADTSLKTGNNFVGGATGLIII